MEEDEKPSYTNKKRNICQRKTGRDGWEKGVSDIFKTLVSPMKEQGFIRDANQLIVKYKNLKGECF